MLAPPPKRIKIRDPHQYTHSDDTSDDTLPDSPPKTSPKNLRTLTPILEVRSPVAKAFWEKRGRESYQALEHRRLSCLSCSSALRLFAWTGNSHRLVTFIPSPATRISPSHKPHTLPGCLQQHIKQIGTKVLTNHLSQFFPQRNLAVHLPDWQMWCASTP